MQFRLLNESPYPSLFILTLIKSTASILLLLISFSLILGLAKHVVFTSDASTNASISAIRRHLCLVKTNRDVSRILEHRYERFASSMLSSSLVKPEGIWSGCFLLEEHKSFPCAVFRFHTTPANASLSEKERNRKMLFLALALALMLMLMLMLMLRAVILATVLSLILVLLSVLLVLSSLIKSGLNTCGFLLQ